MPGPLSATGRYTWPWAKQLPNTQKDGPEHLLQPFRRGLPTRAPEPRPPVAAPRARRGHCAGVGPPPGGAAPLLTRPRPRPAPWGRAAATEHGGRARRRCCLDLCSARSPSAPQHRLGHGEPRAGAGSASHSEAPPSPALGRPPGRRCRSRPWAPRRRLPGSLPSELPSLAPGES